jgi:hypothetical protein
MVIQGVHKLRPAGSFRTARELILRKNQKQKAFKKFEENKNVLRGFSLLFWKVVD